MKSVAIYCRVSTTNQAEDGYSIGEQQDKLRKYCDIMGWNVAEVYTDAGFSGSNIERPAMQKMLKAAKLKQFNTILVYKLDRLSRSTSDNLYLIKEVFKKNNIEFVSLNEKIDTSDAMGEFFFTLLAAVAEMERKTISERMALGRLGRAKAGKTMSYQLPPFGYTRNKEKDILEVVPLEASIVREIYKSYLDGESITKICKSLNDNGHIGKNKRWSHSTVRNALTNTAYIAKGKFKGQMYEQDHEKIISEDIFWAAQKEIEKRQVKESQRTNQSRPFQSKYMLSGLMRCGYCGANIVSVTGNKRSDGTKPIRYECAHRNDYRRLLAPGQDKCSSGFYRRLELEAYVIDYISKLKTDKIKLDELMSETNIEQVDREYIKAELKVINKKIEKENFLFRNDYIDEIELQQNIKNLIESKKAFEIKLVDEENNAVSKHKVQRLQSFIKSEDIKDMDYEQQKKMVKSFVSIITVTAEKITIKFNF
ncbi:recombinase family protein [Lactococcus garvieae]|uniref:Site-specific recombinase n=1 Tax=Lactococcus garvieae DCC43 TaxID=1231377 RepID=K2NXV6_9LACT|nr:recombinase family protein [Lactococcus garvieae]EKF52428.1 site-specific recombinase [Lactococcus garvieae DCC43]